MLLKLIAKYFATFLKKVLHFQGNRIKIYTRE